MIKIILKYSPQKERVVNPVSELATPHAFTVIPIVIFSGSSCPGWMSGNHSPLFKNCLSSLLSSGYPPSASFITRRIFSPDSCEATLSGRTSTYPFVPAI